MKTRGEGIRGESLAEGYLVDKGYKILGRNEKLMGIPHWRTVHTVLIKDIQD